MGHTEDSEMREPSRMSEAELIDALDTKFGTKSIFPDEPVWIEDDFSELNEAFDAFTAKYGPDAPDVSRYPIDPERAAKKAAWYASQGFGTLRVKAIEVSKRVGNVSRKTRYEFEGGGPCIVLGVKQSGLTPPIIGEEIFVAALEPEDVDA